MMERLAAYHFGQAVATSTSVENGPSLAAAMDHRVSPAFTSTPLPDGAGASREPGRLSSPGASTGGRGCQLGSCAAAAVLLLSAMTATAVPAPFVEAGAMGGRTVLLCPEVGSHSGVGETLACARPPPRRFSPSTAIAILTIKAGLNLESVSAPLRAPARCRRAARNAITKESTHQATIAVPAMLAVNPANTSNEKC